MAELTEGRPLKLVIFDVDGTLIDSLAHIKWAMGVAFEACDLPQPSEDAIRGIVGLSLPQVMLRLRPDLSETGVMALITAYSEAFGSHAEQRPDVSFFPGALQALQTFAGHDDLLLGVATGKSRRGMDRIIHTHKLEKLFQTVQVADDHPSKPHPSMIHTALNETGVEPENAVIVGDTSFDLEMGRAAGIKTTGVSWGYHPVEALMAHADTMIDAFADLPGAIAGLIGDPT